MVTRNGDSESSLNGDSEWTRSQCGVCPRWGVGDVRVRARKLGCVSARPFNQPQHRAALRPRAAAQASRLLGPGPTASAHSVASATLPPVRCGWSTYWCCPVGPAPQSVRKPRRLRLSYPLAPSSGTYTSSESSADLALQECPRVWDPESWAIGWKLSVSF